MKEIFYRITLLEPGLFTALEGDPNSGVSFPFIPGSVLRGALIHKYRANHVIDPAAEAARQLFFNGNTRFLNGYPSPSNALGQPTPLSWQHEKRVEDSAMDAAGQTPDPKKQWTGVKKPFARKAGDTATVIDPERQLTIHIQRPRAAGRPKRNDGAIYRYEALAPNQVFIAVIQCDVDSDAQELGKLVSGEVSLGGARTGAYGRARIELVKADELAQMQTQSKTVSQASRHEFYVILESDALLRDEWGQYTCDAKVVRNAIAARLGVKDANELGEPKAWMQTRYVGGFNRTWGLPLPQMMAIEMGSVFEFAMPSGDLKWTELETKGIGERRAEGFGRVAVYQPTEQTLDLKKWEYQVAGQAENLDEDSDKVARQMVERLMRKRLDENVVAVAYALEMDPEKLKPIRPAQLSRLRNIIHDELMSLDADKSDAKEVPAPAQSETKTKKEKPRERIQKYMTDVLARNTSKKQFTHARVDGMRLSDWIQELLELKPEHKRLSALFEVGSVPSLGKYTPHVTPELKDEYALKFLDAALRRALNVKREKEG